MVRLSKALLVKVLFLGIAFTAFTNLLVGWHKYPGNKSTITLSSEFEASTPSSLKNEATLDRTEKGSTSNSIKNTITLNGVEKTGTSNSIKNTFTLNGVENTGTSNSVKNTITLNGVEKTGTLNSSKNSTKERAFLVIGVPTVKRKKATYLVQTLRELVERLDETEKHEVLIVVFIAEFEPSVIQSIKNEIFNSFSKELDSGLLRVITAPRSFYPDLTKLPLLWGDKPDRVRWRSKQSLDYAYLFDYCKDLGQYYLQIEDDVSTSKDYLKKIKSFIKKYQNRDWSMLDFGTRGFIGMMYRSTDVGRLAMFVKTFFWVYPVDFLFRQFNDFHLYGNPDWLMYKPPLFQHLGVFSSLDGQLRLLQDVKTEQRIYKDSNNPDAEISTSIKDHYQDNSISVVYDTVHHGMFWGKNIKIGDFILIRFVSSVQISKIIVESGGTLAPEDYFGGSKISYSKGNHAGECGDFTVWQEYKNVGQLKLVSSNPKGTRCRCLKIEITEIRKDKNGSVRWLAVREIAVWTAG